MLDENIKNHTISLDLTKEYIVYKDPVKTVDEDWVKNNFLLSLSELDNLQELTLFTSSADRKITNTGLGKSLAINPPYAFTRYTDPPIPGRIFDTEYFSTANLKQSLGMGAYYSEAIDDNNTTSLLYLTPGVVKFGSLISVFTRATDYKTSVVANEGRYPTMYDYGKPLGEFGIFLVFPVRSVLIYLVKRAVSTIPLFTDHSFYSIKPTPSQYWMMVQNITNSLSTERGVLAYSMVSNSERVGAVRKADATRMKYLADNFPTIFLKSGGVNVFGIATRAQKTVTKQLFAEMRDNHKYYTSSGLQNVNEISGKYQREPASELHKFIVEQLGGTIADDPDKTYKGSDLYKTEKTSSDTPKTNENPPDDTINDYKVDGLDPLPSEKSSYVEDVANAAVVTAQHGAESAVFHVDYVGSTSDTFSNTVKDIPLKDKINSLGGAARDIRFTLAGGNIMGDTINAVTNGVKDLVAGTASGLTFGLSDLIFGLLDGGYMRFGKMWQDSSAQLQSHTFKMRLGGPYNNKISQVIDQDLVLGMILPLVLPQSVGHGTYTSPLMVRAYMRGICNLDRAMVTGLSITRGDGNLGHVKSGRATNLIVSITITDMSELLVAPLGDSMYNSFNQETALSRYISTLGARDFRTNAFMVPKLKMGLANTLKEKEVLVSGSSLGLKLADSVVGDIAGILLPDVSVATFNDSLK